MSRSSAAVRRSLLRGVIATISGEGAAFGLVVLTLAAQSLDRALQSHIESIHRSRDACCTVNVLDALGPEPLQHGPDELRSCISGPDSSAAAEQETCKGNERTVQEPLCTRTLSHTFLTSLAHSMSWTTASLSMFWNTMVAARTQAHVSTLERATRKPRLWFSNAT
eukprot:2488471-Rhodomonas_salina.1